MSFFRSILVKPLFELLSTREKKTVRLHFFLNAGFQVWLIEFLAKVSKTKNLNLLYSQAISGIDAIFVFKGLHGYKTNVKNDKMKKRKIGFVYGRYGDSFCKILVQNGIVYLRFD